MYKWKWCQSWKLHPDGMMEIQYITLGRLKLKVYFDSARAYNLLENPKNFWI